MSEKKKPVDKKSIQYVRPQPQSFTLESMPGVQLTFRKPTVDDVAWCQEHFKMHPLALMQEKQRPLADLCRIYFHYLDASSKAHFAPKEYVDYDENGVETKETAGGWRRLMKEITGGHTEVLAIGRAFLMTLLSFRPLDTFSDEEKKTLVPLLDELETKGRAEQEARRAQPGA